MRHQYQKSGSEVASVCISRHLDAWRLLAFHHHNKHAGARCLSSYQKANTLGMALTNEVSIDIPIRGSESGVGVIFMRQNIVEPIRSHGKISPDGNCTLFAISISLGHDLNHLG